MPTTTKPTAQELSYMLVEVYLRLNAMAEFLKPFAIAEQNRQFYKRMTPAQRYRWQAFGFPDPFGDNGIVRECSPEKNKI